MEPDAAACRRRNQNRRLRHDHFPYVISDVDNAVGHATRHPGENRKPVTIGWLPIIAASPTDDLAHPGTRSLIFAGVTTEVCVQTTTRDANDRGFTGLLAEDATESCFPAFKAATPDMIRAQGAMVGWTATTDQIPGAIGV